MITNIHKNVIISLDTQRQSIYLLKFLLIFKILLLKMEFFLTFMVNCF